MVAGSCLLLEVEGNRADSVCGVLLQGEVSPGRNPLLLHGVLAGSPPLGCWELLVVTAAAAVWVWENGLTRPMPPSQCDPLAMLAGWLVSVLDSHWSCNCDPPSACCCCCCCCWVMKVEAFCSETKSTDTVTPHTTGLLSSPVLAMMACSLVEYWTTAISKSGTMARISRWPNSLHTSRRDASST